MLKKKLVLIQKEKKAFILNEYKLFVNLQDFYIKEELRRIKNFLSVDKFFALSFQQGFIEKGFDCFVQEDFNVENTKGEEFENSGFSLFFAHKSLISLRKNLRVIENFRKLDCFIYFNFVRLYMVYILLLRRIYNSAMLLIFKIKERLLHCKCLFFFKLQWLEKSKNANYKSIRDKGEDSSK